MEPSDAVHLPAKRPADYPLADSTPLQKKHGLNKVAEIVLVLSAMAVMRGVRSPTRAELNLMAEARSKLVEVCEKTLTPKDLVTKESADALIDDLGLNKRVKEQNFIVSPPKLSIADKLLHTKKRMEESAKEVNARIVALVANSSTDHVRRPRSGSSVYPMNSNNRKPHMISGVLNQPGKTTSFTLPGAVKHHYGGPSHVTAGSSFDHGQKNPSIWSVQPQTLSRVTPQAARNQPPGTSGANMPAHQSLQETATGQGVPLVGNHNDISNTVHKLLQKKAPERPTWTPPSRDYMNKVVMCQVCHHSIKDVESVFLCDACEHAYHLRCLPSSNQKVVPRGEWHCPKCLQLSNGKPLPSKYGRVTRNVTASKVPSKVTGFHTSSHQRVSMQKVRAVDPPSAITGSVASSTRFSESDRKPDQNEL